MGAAFGYIPDLGASIEIPENGILSRTVYEDPHVKAVLFGFSTGQELSEHTASKPAMLLFLRGQADVKLGPERVQAAAGAWIHMPPHLPHAVRTHAPTAMLLVLFKGAASQPAG